MQKRGGFIVIDGTDGSGKATQTKLLLERMYKEDHPVETISFPQYGKKSCGPVEEYLSGKYGAAHEVGPYRSSILYAVDRFDASSNIENWLQSGKNVVADRYVGSNMGHQGSKIVDVNERHAFFEWEMELEHETFGIPRPDINIILHVPTDIALELMQKREQDGGAKHDLKKDIHESDPNHLRASEQAYLDLANQYEQFVLVECVENDNLLSPQQIHERVWALVEPVISREA